MVRFVDEGLYLKPDQRFALIILVWSHSRRLSSYDAQFHVFDLQPDQQEVYSAHYNVLQVVLALAVLKLDMQAILDSNIHFNTTIRLGWNAVRVNPDVFFTDHVCHAARHGDANKIPQLHVYAVI